MKLSGFGRYGYYPVPTTLTRAPLGYFYNAPHWGGGYFEPPSDLRNYWTDSKIQVAFESPGKTVEGKQILLTSGSRVTSQVRSKLKMFDISGLVTSASKIAMLSTNKGQLIGMDSVSDICKYHLLCFMTIIEVKVMSGPPGKKGQAKKNRDLELRYMFLGQIFGKDAKNDPKTLFEASKSVKI